jgi:RNA polymerase sigma-70 factor, ECF subfamily
MTVEMEAEATTSSSARVPRGLSLPGRRRQRAAGERIAALFAEHGRMVYGVSRLLLRDPVEAEDAAQQTFLSAYRALLAGQEPRDPSAWLGTIARNECRARLRARQVEPLTLVQEPAGDELQRDAARREEIHALCTALAELPPQQRDAVVLREFYGLSYAEVAAALGLTGAAVESLLFRGRKRLQERLRPVRSGLGVLTLPLSLRESLAQALPGFGAAGASTGAAGAVLAKLASAPLASKIAAVTLALGTVGTVASVEHARRTPPRRVAAHARHGAVVAQARVKRPHVIVHTASAASVLPVTYARVAASRRPRRDGEHAGASSRGSGEVEHEQSPQPEPQPATTRSGGDSGGGSGGDSAGGSGGEQLSHDGGGEQVSRDGGGSTSVSDGSGSRDSGDRGATGASGPDGSGSDG